MNRWLRSLPVPIGLLACDDERGRQVLEACRAAGLRVPEDVAVIGVDNDELLCDLSDPALSSVVLDTLRAGFEAAKLLDGLMSGRVNGTHRIQVQPLYVLARRSTDTTAVDDPHVAAAVRFIHDFSNRPINVADIVAHVGISRRSLELAFTSTWAVRCTTKCSGCAWSAQAVACGNEPRRARGCRGSRLQQRKLLESRLPSLPGRIADGISP